MKMEQEIWRPIPGYELRFHASNFGNIKSIRRTSASVLIPNIAGKGYLQVGLSQNNSVTNFYVHRLIALAFLANPENKPQVNHINGNKTDNRVVNLEEVVQRSKLEKKLKRVHKGTCPCCNRSFVNVKRHMETKHPDQK